MQKVFNVYCDESCHLEKDRASVMVLGAVWCPFEKSREIATRLRDLKRRHNMPPGFELKWGRVGTTKLEYYTDVLDYFFDDDDLRLRILIAPKDQLDHAKFPGQSHDDWYYKMYFFLLRWMIGNGGTYRVFIDQKDTQGHKKVQRLREYLCNDQHDFEKKIVQQMSIVRSIEVEQVQLADFLCGIVSYAARGLATSPAKVSLVERTQARFNRSLTSTTRIDSDKINIFRWQPQTRAV